MVTVTPIDQPAPKRRPWFWKLTRRSVLVVLALASCSPATPTASTTGSASTTSSGLSSPVTTSTLPHSSTTVHSSTTTTIPNGTSPDPVDEWTLEPATAEIPNGWDLVVTIPYGEDEALLGSAPGGENLMLGPSYGAQAPDGSWWFLDAAKDRLAHYDRDGSYVGSVYLPEDYLVDGVYFQYQLPRVLADGTVVAARFDETSTEFLISSGNELRKTSIAGAQIPRADDGSILFGFDFEGTQWSLDPTTAEWQPVDWFRGQDGSSYRIGIVEDGFLFARPDPAIEMMIPVRSTVGPGAVHPTIEVAVGADGVTHVFLLGISESDESIQLAGYATIGADGVPSDLEPMINPFTPADPGHPSHLGVAFGSSKPYFMIIGEDGVQIYQRS